MPLVDLWRTEEARSKKLSQLISFAGPGKLADGNQTSLELRALLGEVSSEALARFADECLNESFPDSGFALQDIINEAGLRLGYLVKPGPYRGKVDYGNRDATWVAPDGWSMIVEVKTTSAYQISVTKVASYLDRLISSGHATAERSSILIVVGRDSTEDFEAQIRGSRYAWTVRMISVRALFRLLEIGIYESSALAKIHRIFIPEEYTKIDNIIDLVFETVEASREILPGEVETFADADVASSKEFLQPFIGARGKAKEPQKYLGSDVRLQCIDRVQARVGTALTAISRSIFVTPSGGVAVMCAVSKRYRDGIYWFAFHAHYDKALLEARDSYVAFGCGSAQSIIFMPFSAFSPLLLDMNVSKGDRMYRHVHIWHRDGQWSIRLSGKDQYINVTEYLL